MLNENHDSDRRFEEDRRRTETFRRIHQLYKRGFRPDWTVTAVDDAIWWKHAGGYPGLILYSDGKFVARSELIEINPSDQHNKDRIHNTSTEDAARFDRWIASVKSPTWWQSGAEARARYIYVPLFWGSAISC